MSLNSTFAKLMNLNSVFAKSLNLNVLRKHSMNLNLSNQNLHYETEVATDPERSEPGYQRFLADPDPVFLEEADPDLNLFLPSPE